MPLTDSPISLGSLERSAARVAGVGAPDLDAALAALLIPEDVEPGETELLHRLRDGLNAGRQAIRVRFEADGVAGGVLRDHARLIDRLVTSLLERAKRRYPLANPTTAERLAVLAIGGYGRREMAPHSDVDLLFVLPYKRTPHAEELIEYLLYKLWDLGLKVGHATRAVGECVRAARDDVTIATGLLEARLVWGHPQPFEDLRAQFEREVIAARGPAFVEAKLAERDDRHRRVGDSRYLLEPNVKEGKGGLRDLHTLLWLGRFLYRVEDPAQLAGHGMLSAEALRTFTRAEQFLWAVRCHLHYLTGRAEERLTFDLQPEVARRMGYRDTAGASRVERFMKHYYRAAKEVGALTRIVCAALEEQHKRRPALRFARLGRRRIDGFEIQGGRVALAEPGLFEREPASMLRLFRLAQERDLDIHPLALRSLSQNLHRIDYRLRRDPAAGALFLAMLTSPKDPAVTLTRMNESGLLGRLIPEFGRVVAQMQYDLYHVYTVDEHTIRAIGELNRIERGELADELPLATEILPKTVSRTELYVATFLHDIAKGLGPGHSERGARIAERVCPRLGLSDEQTETVAWLVRHHLLLSRTAFGRDPEDPKTITDLVEAIQSPERLRLLLVLTVADIRAVGPNAWNGWKGQLLRALYYEVEAALVAGGDLSGRRRQRIEAAKARLRAGLSGWTDAEFEAYVQRHDPRYWLTFYTESLERHAAMVRSADREGRPVTVACHVDAFRARTAVELYAPDQPGLFMKVAGALALSGVSIVDARVFTTTDGMALDSFGVQDAQDRTAIAEPRRLERIREAVEQVLTCRPALEPALAGRRAVPARTDVFQVEPRVLFDDSASRTHTVIEVNGRDRPGLLYDLAKALKELGLIISSAHISTYGERVVDVFYVKDMFGLKLTQGRKLKRVQRRLLEALAGGASAPTEADRKP